EYTPSATFFLTAESLRRRRPTTVVIAYTVEDFSGHPFEEMLRETSIPALYVHRKTPSNAKDLSMLLPWTKDMRSLDERVTAYLCKEETCRPPVYTRDDLKRLILEG
ncbi:MAG: hypothetical protein D6726_04035, partial [Nitrospirae bacterium]